MEESGWSRPVDAYCERIDAGFWSEPVNALSNAAFIVAAIWAGLLWLRAPRRDWPVAILIVVAAAVGVGSFLFHTFATRWAALADVLPITVFIVFYFFLAMRRFLVLPLWPALGVTTLFQGLSMLAPAPWLDLAIKTFGFDPLNGSAAYLPAAAAIAVVGVLVRRDKPEVARELFAVAGIFAASLTLRSVDLAVCGVLPLGTHFLWHLLNGLVLLLLLRVAIREGPR